MRLLSQKDQTGDSTPPVQGGEACALICKHDHCTPTREIRRHVWPSARNHPEGRKLQVHISPVVIFITGAEKVRAAGRDRVNRWVLQDDPFLDWEDSARTHHVPEPACFRGCDLLLSGTNRTRLVVILTPPLKRCVLGDETE